MPDARGCSINVSVLFFFLVVAQMLLLCALLDYKLTRGRDCAFAFIPISYSSGCRI